MTRHFVNEFAPKIERPHFGNVRLGRIGIIGIARCADVQWNIELDTALGDVWRMYGVNHLFQALQPYSLGNVQTAIHGTIGVSANH